MRIGVTKIKGLLGSQDISEVVDDGYTEEQKEPPSSLNKEMLSNRFGSRIKNLIFYLSIDK